MTQNGGHLVQCKFQSNYNKFKNVHFSVGFSGSLIKMMDP